MYVCIGRGCPLWNCPLLRAIQLGLGEGPIGIAGPMFQTRGGTIDAASHKLDHTSAFLNQLYSRQLRVSCKKFDRFKAGTC